MSPNKQTEAKDKVNSSENERQNPFISISHELKLTVWGVRMERGRNRKGENKWPVDEKEQQTRINEQMCVEGTVRAQDKSTA